MDASQRPFEAAEKLQAPTANTVGANGIQMVPMYPLSPLSLQAKPDIWGTPRVEGTEPMCPTCSWHKTRLKLLIWERGAEENHLYQGLTLLHPKARTQQTPDTQVRHLKARKHHNTQAI